MTGRFELVFRLPGLLWITTLSLLVLYGELKAIISQYACDYLPAEKSEWRCLRRRAYIYSVFRMSIPHAP